MLDFLLIYFSFHLFIDCVRSFIINFSSVAWLASFILYYVMHQLHNVDCKNNCYSIHCRIEFDAFVSSLFFNLQTKISCCSTLYCISRLRLFHYYVSFCLLSESFAVVALNMIYIPIFVAISMAIFQVNRQKYACICNHTKEEYFHQWVDWNEVEYAVRELNAHRTLIGCVGCTSHWIVISQLWRKTKQWKWKPF